MCYLIAGLVGFFFIGYYALSKVLVRQSQALAHIYLFILHIQTEGSSYCRLNMGPRCGEQMQVSAYMYGVCALVSMGETVLSRPATEREDFLQDCDPRKNCTSHFNIIPSFASRFLVIEITNSSAYQMTWYQGSITALAVQLSGTSRFSRWVSNVSFSLACKSSSK